MKKFNHKGFTVLELLVILGIIIIILMALVLVALGAIRSRSSDERKVALLRPVVIELQDYFSVCRSYPKDISQSELANQPCQEFLNLSLSNQSKTIRDIIPSAYDLNFNGTGSEYYYQALEVSSLPGTCTNFHLWVKLNDPGGTLLQQKSNITSADYTTSNLTGCQGLVTQPQLTTPNDDTIVDIFK